MGSWLQLFLIILGATAVLASFKAYGKCRYEGKSLEITPGFFIFGAFVWADVFIFGIFWALFCLVSLFLSDFLLFLFGYSLFWVVRSLGETFYWFNQQFSNIIWHQVHEMSFFKIFKNEKYTSWFVMQIMMQCITVISGILSLYFGKLWLSTRF